MSDQIRYLSLILYFSTITRSSTSSFFFFNDTATTEIYTLSLHDALPISDRRPRLARGVVPALRIRPQRLRGHRSEEHTSELQSPDHLVCRLLLEKKKKNTCRYFIHSF